MRDYPCKFGEGCKKKDSGCNYVHPGDPNYQQSVRQKESQDSRHGGPSSGNRRFANATASNTTSLPDGVRRWGNASNTGARKSSASENNASSSWNFSASNAHSPSASLTADTSSGFGNSGWGSTDINTPTPNGTGWGTGGAGSTWANDDAAVGWNAGKSTDRKDDGWGTGNSGGQKDNGGWGASNSGGHKDNGGWGTANPGGHKDAGGSGADNAGGHKDDGGWGAAIPGGHQDSGGPWAATPGGDGGWGAVNPGGQKDNGGWGTGSSGGHIDGGGWGSTNSNTARSHSTDAGSKKGWDQSATSSLGSWGSMTEKSSDAQKDKWRKADDIQMRDPSPMRKRDEPQPKPVQQTPQSPSKLLAESPAQMPLSPKYVSLPSAISTKPPPDLKSLALEFAKPKAAPVKVKGVEGRRALYQSIIKHMKNAIIAHIEYQEAQGYLNQWKDTQMSTIYGHATQKTRKILDSERAAFHRRVQDGEDAFKKEINALVDLPEWSTTNRKKGKVLTKEDIAAYTRELQDWFKDLDIHKRLLMEGEPEEGEIADEKEEGEVNDSDDESIGQRMPELLRTGKLTWKKLTEALEAMQSRYDAIQTNVYFDIFTSIDDDSKARLAQASANLESIEHEEIQDGELSAVSEKIAATGKNLERQSEGLARLLAEATELEKEIEAVRVQTTQASSVCQLAGRLFGDFEQWKVDDNAQLTATTEQVKQLRLYQPTSSSTLENQIGSVATTAAPPQPPASSRSAPESISLSDLIDPIRRLVVDAIHRELKQCFEHLRFRCMENQQKLEAEMEENAKSIMFKAEHFRRKLEVSRGPSIHSVIPSQSYAQN